MQIFPNCSVPCTSDLKGKARHSNQVERIRATIVHRDIRRLVVLLSVEEQAVSQDSDASARFDPQG